MSFTITVNHIPTPDVPTQLADQVYNPGDAVPALIRSSITTASDMGWSQTNPAIGLSTTGGQGFIIPGFTATNESCTDNISSVFSVVGLNGGHCPGPPMSFTITVNHIPTPDVPTQVADQIYNPGDAVPALLRPSITTASDMGWSQTNTAIGLNIPGGQGFLIPGFTATNPSCTDAISSVFSVSGLNGGHCPGPPMSFTITVNSSKPVINTIANQTYNPGDAVPSIAFTSNLPGAAISWSRTSESIGLASTSGSGNVPSFTASNLACGPVTSTFTVIAQYGGCTSNPIQFTVTVNAIPPPHIDAGPNRVVYKGYADSSCTKLQSAGAGGGIGPYTLTWSTGSHAAFINVCPTATTVYYLTITDSRGCTATDSVKVCVIDVRCGSGNKKVTICHGTGSVTNPYGTLCIDPADAKWHFLNHPGDQLGACGMNKSCTFPPKSAKTDEADAYIAETETADDRLYIDAFPNPFSDKATIRFMLPDDAQVELKVLDVTGKEVAHLFKGNIDGGSVNEATFDCSQCSGGLYLLSLTDSRGTPFVKKLVLNK
jgi:hypothetical protein